MEAVSYGSVYVAQVALGGNDTHVVKAFQEAEAHDGPSIIIAYASCIAHGYDLVHGLEQQKLAVQSGYWPLMRYNPGCAKRARIRSSSIPRRRRSAEGICVSRSSLYDAGAQQSGGGGGVAERSARRCGTPMARLLGQGRNARPRRNSKHCSRRKAGSETGSRECRR